MDLAELQKHQRESLWLDGHSGLYTVDHALAFLNAVGVALRYAAATTLPLASMYRATQRQVPEPEDERSAHARAFELTNMLLATGRVMELNLIADRLALAHERVMPAIYALRRGTDEPHISDAARQTLDFIVSNQRATAGDIRRRLRAEGTPRPDAADLALSELQRELLVDRGPSIGPSTGVFYLTREGYPYRAFAPAHPATLQSAGQLSRSSAAVELMTAYLGAAVYATELQLARVFKSLLNLSEIQQCIQQLSEAGVVRRLGSGKRQVIVDSRWSIAA